MTRHLTLERARGRWPEILNRFGIDRTFLRNRHGPCPVCGGKDRFRFDDKAGSGSWFCNQCDPQAGAGINLLMNFRDWDFRTAATEIDRLIGTDYDPAPPPPKPTSPPLSPWEELHRQWEKTIP